MALGAAAELCRTHLTNDTDSRLQALRDRFEHLVRAGLPDVIVHGSGAPRLPNTSSYCLRGIEAAGMLILLDRRSICVSAGSACHTASLHPSHVLEAMGISAGDAACTLRVSFQRFNTLPEAETAAAAIIECAHKLRAERGDDSMVISS